MALLTVPICLLWQEYFALSAFLVTALLSLILGQLFYWLGQGAEQAQLKQTMIVVALSWGLIPWLGAIPFLMIAHGLAPLAETAPTILYFRDVWSALFEAVSGFTSAGLSMAIRPSQLPHSLQWWRSFMQWIGGVGVIVLMLAVLQPSTDAYRLYSAEGREDRLGLTIGQTVKRIWWIYGLFTVAGVMLLRVAGMTWWEALNHAMCAIATGGFSVTDSSIGGYGSAAKLGVILIMIFGAVSFSTHYAWLYRRRFRTLWQDSQHWLLWCLLLIGCGILLLENYWFSGTFRWLDTSFQWVSALTTCGFSTEPVQFWSPSGKLLLSLGMIMGAASGSTVGGLKLGRVSILFKAVVWRFRRISLSPHEMLRYQLDNQVLSQETAYRWIESAAVLLMLWLGSIAVGIFLLIHVVPSEYTLSDIFFEVASALGSAGLSTGITGPEMNLTAKITLTAMMWMGRLEIFPVLLLLTMPVQQVWRLIWGRRKKTRSKY
ncbi:TrkH family potassium uptake protein [Romeria aff. gracilis LEGE 07310]|uniref:TrkH family potassium uptake protein n=2 Tax=Vasconcelosia TaxID=3366328 RepID=A0A8J7DCQ0_9CYAN|nr:TrkH family potassium uptake protein [Romeria aff. gracilis LEGE 07310]